MDSKCTLGELFAPEVDDAGAPSFFGGREAFFGGADDDAAASRFLGSAWGAGGKDSFRTAAGTASSS